MDQQHAASADGTNGILDELPVGVLVVDADRRVLFENEALRAMWSGLIREPADGVVPAEAYDEDGVRLDAADWPIWRALAGETVEHEVAIELERPAADPVSVAVSARPIHDTLGTANGALMLVREVTEVRERAALRDAFLGVLSHELKTPITAIYSGIALLRGAALDPAVRAGVLDDVAIEAESLSRIVDDLLMIARIEGGSELGPQEPVLPRAVAEVAVRDERRRWSSTTFVVDLPRGLPAVRADEGLLRQVLRNLLSNAAKYGRPDGTVRVAGEMVGGFVRLRVLDDGPGIQGDPEWMFDLLVRGDTSRHLPGAGIGLYVARSLVEGMGGQLGVGSPAVGAEFILDLPVYDDADAVD